MTVGLGVHRRYAIDRLAADVSMDEERRFRQGVIVGEPFEAPTVDGELVEHVVLLSNFHGQVKWTSMPLAELEVLEVDDRQISQLVKMVCKEIAGGRGQLTDRQRSSLATVAALVADRS